VEQVASKFHHSINKKEDIIFMNRWWLSRREISRNPDDQVYVLLAAMELKGIRQLEQEKKRFLLYLMEGLRDLDAAEAILGSLSQGDLDMLKDAHKAAKRLRPLSTSSSFIEWIRDVLLPVYLRSSVGKRVPPVKKKR
jgi:hypothetical protein